MQKGVLIISLGNPYYVRMAYQLAYSIKCNENIPIALANDNAQFLSEDQKNIFDILIDVPKEIIDDKKYFRAKTYIYDLSPFDETIYLDADMIILNENKLSGIFDQLSDVDFTMACRGNSPIKDATKKTSIWGDVTKLGLSDGFWYQLSSEFIYFKKKENIKKLFDTAKEIYDSQIDHNNFAGGMADEYAFGISCIKNNIYPHKENFTPIYWSHAENRPQRIIDPFINKNYWGFSMGGAHASVQQKGFYDNMLSWYQQTSGKKIQAFPAESKSRYLQNRKKI